MNLPKTLAFYRLDQWYIALLCPTSGSVRRDIQPDTVIPDRCGLPGCGNEVAQVRESAIDCSHLYVMRITASAGTINHRFNGGGGGRGVIKKIMFFIYIGYIYLSDIILLIGH